MVGLKQREIDSLGKWYQTIDFGKFGKSKGSATDLDKKWELIKGYLPFSLVGKSILDLGCNAGYFDFKAIREEQAKHVTCVESNKVFQRQFVFSLCTLSELHHFVHSQYIMQIWTDAKCLELIKVPSHLLNEQGIYDITFAFNFFYWLTYSDEEGSIEKPQDAFLRCLNKLAYHTEYMLVIGAEGVGKMREKNNANDLGTSLQRTLPFLEVYFDILKKDIIRQSRKRLSNIILCRSKKRS